MLRSIVIFSIAAVCSFLYFNHKRTMRDRDSDKEE